LVGLPALGGSLLPVWQVAQAVAATTVWFMTGADHLVKLAVVALVWQLSHVAPVTGMWVAVSPALGTALVPVWQVAQGVAVTTL
jgi:hypothetical protein